MGKKKGHRQFKDLRYKIFHSDNPFSGYPHRRHKKNISRVSGVGRIRESAHIEELEDEIRELI
jgi:hypothetical protein